MPKSLDSLGRKIIYRLMRMLWRRTLESQPDYFQERYAKRTTRWYQYRNKETGRFAAVCLVRYTYIINFPKQGRGAGMGPYYGCRGQIWAVELKREHKEFIQEKVTDMVIDYMGGYSFDELEDYGWGWEGHSEQEIQPVTKVERKRLENYWEVTLEDEDGAPIPGYFESGYYDEDVEHD